MGFRLMIDFHYGFGSWADPNKQYKPKAWEGNLNFTDLKKQFMTILSLNCCEKTLHQNGFRLAIYSCGILL